MLNQIKGLIKVVGILVLTTFTNQALANWQFGVDVLSVKSDNQKKVNALVGVVGYQFKLSDKLSIIPELSLGSGIKKRSTNEGKLKLTYYMETAVRGRYQLSDKLFVIAGPIVNKTRYKFKNKGVSNERNGKWRLGFNGGIGYQFGTALSFETSYSKTKDNSIWQAGLRYKF
ncbi:MAG: porin family protein [Photobacterium aquimaris]|nr:porin family protein [Photobacterium aquimaris]